MDKKVNRFTGVIPPVSTIVTEEGNLDEKGMGLLIDNLIERGVDGLFFLGTGGEFSQMTFEQRRQVAEFAVKTVDGRVPVLIGTGATSTREVVELNSHAHEIGADGVVIINPYYVKLSEENLFHHFSTAAAASKLPVLLYNFPLLTDQDLSTDFVLRLVNEHENIVGIKETVKDIGHIRDMILNVKAQHPGFSVFCGFEDLFLNTLSLGGDGIIGATGNFAPEPAIEMFRTYWEGDLHRALKLNETLAYLPELYSLDSPFMNVIKEAVSMVGLDISTAVLAPSRSLPEEKKEKLSAILNSAGVLQPQNANQSTE
ncbi:dihydrodipicolinate synthase family protein [Alteribacter lacisalsi]|uniref:Dihydrodipicolinate synthase family protein n=1 Tax=Alteribacter lacisalsi TaxID=2045244 RepID=A0A2W0H1C8_9BACI|nr:dihydrodipicolinate synthase family protein [Alteribacter lacisalsi]PYZ95603.1 dihydrodipicolinate synthase family protein [Alteribacter lacisalsi]